MFVVSPYGTGRNVFVSGRVVVVMYGVAHNWMRLQDNKEFCIPALFQTCPDSSTDCCVRESLLWPRELWFSILAMCVFMDIQVMHA